MQEIKIIISLQISKYFAIPGNIIVIYNKTGKKYYQLSGVDN